MSVRALQYVYDSKEARYVYMASKQVSIRFSEEEYGEMVKEASRLKITISAYLRSCVLMRITGDLVEREVAEAEFSRRNIALKKFETF